MISPQENFTYYNKIFDYVSERLGRVIIAKQRKTYHEVNDLLRRQELDFAFIESGAYVEAKREFDAQILVVPQIDKKTESYAYIIVAENSNLIQFEGLKGHSFAFTDPLSNSGYIYPNYLVTTMSPAREKFFSHVIYTYSNEDSIQAVAAGIVDAAGVSSLIFDQLQRVHPEKMAAVRILKKSMPFGMPPVAVHPDIDPNLRNKLQAIFLSMHEDREGRAILSSLGIDRFVPGDDGDYKFLRMMSRLILGK